MSRMPHDPDIFSANINALRSVNPQAAEIVNAAIIPADWQLTTGTDGTPTYCRRINDAKIEWLGRTSMPRTSAQPLMASLKVDQAIGVGTPMASGHEWLALANQLPLSFPVYVYEPDPILAKMALSICDLSARISALKIIPLIGRDAPSQLALILENHIGLETPGVIHPLPSYTGEVRNQLIAQAEQMIRKVIELRSQKISAVAEALAHKPWPACDIPPLADTLSSPVPSLALIYHHDDQLPLAQRVSEHKITTIYINDHRSASALIRLNSLLVNQVQCIESDLLRNQLGVAIPPTLCVRTWVAPIASALFWDPSRLSPQNFSAADRFIVHSSAHAQWLKDAGVPAGQICLTRLPFTPAPQRPRPAQAHEVSLIADIPSLDPATYDIQLPSFVGLWQMLRSLIEEDPLGVNDGMVADLLRRAQQKTGVQIANEHVTRILERGILHILLPGCVAVGLAKELSAAGIQLDLIGEGWQQAGLPAGKARIRKPLLNHDFWENSAAVIQCHPAGIVTPTLLHAASRGIAIIATSHLRDGQPLTLSDYLPQHVRARKQQFIPALKALLK